MKDHDMEGGTMIERDLDDMPFTMIPNDLLGDTDISWKAKGVISYLLGKPPHWKARTKDIENHGKGGESEIRAALKELRNVGYARLERRTMQGRVVRFVYRVANTKKYTMDGGKRVDIALDGGRPQMRSPHVENPHLDDSHVTGSDVENRDIRKNEGRKHDLSKTEKVQKRSSSNKVRASGDGAAVRSTPSADHAGAAAPEPPGPRAKADTFIQEYKSWGKSARITTTVVPEERAALQGFFSDNPEISTRELVALMLCAWQMPVDTKHGEGDFNPFWHCNHKSRKIGTFVQSIVKIQEETDWKASRIDRQYQLAQQKFLQQTAA